MTRSHCGKHPYGAYVALCLGGLAMIVPFIWQFLSSFKSVSEYVQVPPKVVPSSWQFGNYLRVLKSVPFGDMYLNTILIAAVAVAGHVLFGAMAAFAFAKIEFPGRGIIFGVFLSMLMVPRQMLLIPQYEVVGSFNLLNTVPGIMLPNIISVFSIFLLRQFFLSLPGSLVESATLDGAGPLRTFAYIMLPLAKPGLIAVTIFTVVYSWSDLLWPLVVATDADKMPLTAGLATLEGQHFTDYPMVLAGGVMAIVPMVIIFVVLQRRFIQGIAFSGSKG